MQELEQLIRSVVFFGALNSLSQTLLKLTVPGIPDLYQGTEFWDYSLVDPDNRRPVDYSMRERSLEDLQRLIQEKPLRDLATEILQGFVHDSSQPYSAAAITCLCSQPVRPPSTSAPLHENLRRARVTPWS